MEITMTEKNNSNGDFKMKVAEWRGYVLRALEDTEKALGEVEEAQKDLEKEIINCRECRRKEVEESIEKIKDEIIVTIKDYQVNVDKDIKTMRNKLNRIYIKVVAVGVSVGIMASIIFGLFQKFILKALGI